MISDPIAGVAKTTQIRLKLHKEHPKKYIIYLYITYHLELIGPWRFQAFSHH